MLYVDLKYVTTVGIHLRNFKKKKDNLFNCSCPICGDSEKKKSKARGYFYQKGTSMYFKCHNCGSGIGVGNFLKHHFPAYHEQYLLEKYKSGVDTKKTKAAIAPVAKAVLTKFHSSKAIKLSELSDEHYAKQYVIRRKIPFEHYSRIFFTDDFAGLVDDVFPGKYENLQKDEPRLIIPFFDAQNNLTGLQGRSFSPEKSLRYITIRATSNTDLVFGLERFDSTKLGYVVEGPIDSLFLPNCLAAANSDLASVIDKTKNDNLVLVYDNEPRNREIVKLIESAINRGRKVCIWTSNIEQKDINDMILSGTSVCDIHRIIQKRTFSGLEAQLEFCKWKKV
jgi:hypothetical protein